MLPENRSRENCIHHHTFLVNALNRVSTEPAGIPAFVDYWYLKTGLENQSVNRICKVEKAIALLPELQVVLHPKLNRDAITTLRECPNLHVGKFPVERVLLGIGGQISMSWNSRLIVVNGRPKILWALLS